MDQDQLLVRPWTFVKMLVPSSVRVIFIIGAFATVLLSSFCASKPSTASEKRRMTNGEHPQLSIDRILPNLNRPAEDELPTMLRKPDVVKGADQTTRQSSNQEEEKQGLPQDGDEVVDMQTEVKPNGDINLKFTSHGRRHELELTESRQRLADIPIRLLGASSDFEQEVAAEMKKIKMMTDRRRGATVAFKMEDGILEPILRSGSFKIGKHQFDLKPDNPAIEQGRVKVQRQQVKNLAVDAIKGHPAPKNRTRERRASSAITPKYVNVELVMLVDYSAWSAMSSSSPLQSAENIFLYFAHMAQIMDNHFDAMQNDDISISIQLAQLSAITSRYSFTDLIEDHKYYSNGETYINADDALNRFTAWLESSDSSYDLPASYDHVMLLTVYDMVSDEGTATAGLAWRGTICDPAYSSSMVEVRELLTFDASIAAHELGHCLGSGHDGLSSACADENYIMSADKYSEDFLENRFLFSCCSQRAFYATISSLGTCLTNWLPDSDGNDAVYAPGQTFTADDQCYIKDGTSACGDWVYTQTDTSICLNLWCVSPEDSTYCRTQYTAAADGTACGFLNLGWCYQGACVTKGYTNTPIDLNCDVGDCFTGERSCSNGVNVYETSYLLCYPASVACDGFPDCSDGSDEYCGSFSCPLGYSKCTDGYNANAASSGVSKSCILTSRFCDGEEDCSDGSDEADCRDTTEPLDPANCYLCDGSFLNYCVTTIQQCEEKCSFDRYDCERGVRKLRSEYNGADFSIISTFLALLNMAVIIICSL